MKLLWLVNIILPQAARAFGVDFPSSGGWLLKLSEEISRVHDIVYVFPQSFSKNLVSARDEHGAYYGFYEDNKHFEKYDSSREDIFLKIISQEKPDIVHIWGTEFTHSYAMAKVFANPDRTVVSIQGSVSDISASFYSDIPKNVENRWTFRDILLGDNICCQKNKYKKRGEYEQKVLAGVKNIIGRTDWDKGITYKYAKQAEYYHCDEILRDDFYQNAGKWNINDCTKHSIFVSQWYYPIKGFHKVLEAVELLKRDYSDIKIYVAGMGIDLNPSFKKKLKQTSYQRYVTDYIRSHGLTDNIVPLGRLNSEDMMKNMLKSHVFVSGSSIENESNSLSEAKMLGLPCVCSFAGGTTRRIEHEVDGLQYQFEKSFMLASYIKRIFDDDEFATELGINATRSALQVNDINNNVSQMLKIYESIEKK